MSQRSYKRLSLKEREEISRSLAQGLSFRNIAGLLERDVSTISREINRASTNRYTYRAERSQRRASRNASKRRKDKTKLSMSLDLWDYVRRKLLLLWSPEQIAQIIKKEYPNEGHMRISHEAIYTYLYVMPKGELKKQLLGKLRRERKRRHKRVTGIGKPIFCSGKTDNPQWVRLLKGKHVLRYWFHSKANTRMLSGRLSLKRWQLCQNNYD